MTLGYLSDVLIKKIWETHQQYQKGYNAADSAISMNICPIGENGAECGGWNDYNDEHNGAECGHAYYNYTGRFSVEWIGCPLDTMRVNQMAKPHTLLGTWNYMNGTYSGRIVYSRRLWQPMYLETDDRAKIFREFTAFNPSRELMRYAEMLMTNGEADPVHNSTVSFNNCMIRIPNSYNSKYLQKSQSRVRIVQQWNGYKPNIRYLLEGLWEHLIQLRNNEIFERTRFEMRHPYDVTPHSEFTSLLGCDWGWVERLLQKPLGDFRKCCISLIWLHLLQLLMGSLDIPVVSRCADH